MLNIYFYNHLRKINIFFHTLQAFWGFFFYQQIMSLLYIFKDKQQRVSELLHLSFKITLKMVKSTGIYFIFTPS